MAYNLDFSGWKDARRATADSIINQANIAANLIADKAGVLNKIISTGIGAGSRAYSDYRKKKEQEDRFNLAANTGLIPEEQLAPLRDLDEDQAELYKQLLFEKYGIK